MGRRAIGDRPMTAAERQRRRRAKLREGGTALHVATPDRIAQQKSFDLAVLEWEQERRELLEKISKLERQLATARVKKKTKQRRRRSTDPATPPRPAALG